MTKLFVVGFPRDISEIILLELFSVHGSVESVTVVTDKVTGESKGYGFILMTDLAGAERAIAALHGATYQDCTLNVREAVDKHRDHERSLGPGESNRRGSFSKEGAVKPARKKRPRL